MENSKKHGVQNYQTGIVEWKYGTLSEASKKCDELNGKYAHGREDFKEYRTVFLADGKIFDSEREWINS